MNVQTNCQCNEQQSADATAARGCSEACACGANCECGEACTCGSPRADAH